jgi:hypothetical protein
MEGPVDFLQVLPVHMRVDLRGGNIRMAEELLDRRQIGPSLQKVSGKGVP